MQYDQNVLTRTERRIFALRTLYSRAGYRSYRMRKFEDYDLYSRNKDFLLSDRVITFTDTNGRLKALKPDVTLSLVRNLKDRPDELQRLYYDENVYRVSERTNTFKEIMQMGLECIGAADNDAVAEVLDLAEKSLALVAEDQDYLLKVSDLDIMTLLIDDMTDSKDMKAELLKLAGEKNLHGIRDLCGRNDVPAEKCATLTALLGIYGAPEQTLPELEELCRGTVAEAESAEMISVMRELTDDSRRIVIDFSVTGDTSYYNGVAFAGYIEGIPEPVLVGGRYDMLMRRMKKRSRAIGFAVYLDSLGMLGRNAGDRAIDEFFSNTVRDEGGED
ncbi:MAG: ATP phosphoribosyltransferase regulatory subunit [Mogibacterium sp.]|nr:ATP phosphoribosyltransferase regulatory subunit [Mogibacterium sp.]